MAKFSQIVVITAMCMVIVMALPRQYRYYPPTPSRFAGWTVTSQELLALPSQNDPANIVRVAPPAGFLRTHQISRRSVPARFILSTPQFAHLNDNGLVEYYS